MSARAVARSAAPLAWARAHASRFVEELAAFVRFPTVSARDDPSLPRCARWLADQLRAIGLPLVEVIATPRHPIVYGEWCRAPGRPTVLVYGHYDVQPAEPLSSWRSPPFEPVVRGDDLFGRGASDDKGQMFVHVKALEAHLRATGRLPVNVRCLFEGEEEIGSGSLVPFIARHAGALAADVAVLSDMPMLAPDRPALTESMRGALSLEIEVRGPRRDLHSGLYGGAIHNPLQALCELIARLHDHRGHIAIPGFYDRVRELGADERARLRSTGRSDERVLDEAGAARGWGEAGYSLYERTTIRPSLSVNGITGGYQGPGAKAVIPARAAAKLNFRLVPDQDPRAIEELVRRHVARLTPATVRSSVRTSFAAAPASIDREHPAVRVARAALARAFGNPPVFLRSGGTIPVLDLFRRTVGIPTLLVGFALPDDGAHAPNEKFHLPNLHRGVAASIELLDGLAAAWRRPEGGAP